MLQRGLSVNDSTVMVTAREIASREKKGGEKALSFNRKKRVYDEEERNPGNRGQN